MSGLFGVERPVIGMLHLPPSPGVSGFPGIMAAEERMRRDLQTYVAAGVDALLLENMHDFPCVPEQEMGPEIAATMTRLAGAARTLCDELRGGASRPLPLGVQVLFAANRTALAVSQAAGLQFIRAEAWTHAHVSDKGLVDAQGGLVKRYQHRIGAGDILIFTDIKKKHASHSLTADLDVAELAGLMELHRSDGVIITGRVTSDPPDPEDIRAARGSTRLPVILGSGINVENIEEYYPLAEAFIVGSHFKVGGDWKEPVDAARVRAFMKKIQELRKRT